MTEKKSNESANNRRWHEVTTYAIALILCLWILERLLKLRHGDLSVPYLYEGDGMFYSMVIKAIITNGWYLTNGWLGMPHGMELHDFPMPDTFHFLMIKLMGLFTSDYAPVFNLFYLFTYPLTTICTLYVLRHFNISRAPAVLSALLYTFTCYHVSRSQHHLMYTPYYFVPLMVMVILWVCSGNLSFVKTGQGRTRLHLRNPQLIASLMICVLIASTGGAYYSFFAMSLLSSVALFLAIDHRSFSRSLLPGVLIATIFGSFLANLTPNLIYRFNNGNAGVADRNPGEAEIYGLKIAQLLTPINDHRIKSFADFKVLYNRAPLSTENVDSALGIIGSVGFLFLIGWLLYRRTRDYDDRVSELFNHLSLLNITAVLIATIGGFGSLIAHLVLPQIRGYNRISVYIAFFAFFAIALLLDLMSRKYLQTTARQAFFHVLIVALIVAGVLDQTSKRLLPDFNNLKAEYRSDRDFIQQIESVMPPQAMILQLPLHTFPEGESYDHFKGYLHSNNLRWSYGAMRDRSGDRWQKGIAAKPMNEMVETVAAAGFSGIYVDRQGYPDNWEKVESELSSLLAVMPIVSRNGRLSFFSLIEFQQKLRDFDREKVLHPLFVFWLKDFSALEGTPAENWHWCVSTGEMQIENSMSRVRMAILEMTISAVNEGNVRIDSELFSEQLRVNSTPVPLSKQISIPPGKHSIKFICDSAPVTQPPDARTLVFRINNFKLKELKQ